MEVEIDQDHYVVLGASAIVTQSDMKRAHRRLARCCHLDSRAMMHQQRCSIKRGGAFAVLDDGITIAPIIDNARNWARAIRWQPGTSTCVGNGTGFLQRADALRPTRDRARTNDTVTHAWRCIHRVEILPCQTREEIITFIPDQRELTVNLTRHCEGGLWQIVMD